MLSKQTLFVPEHITIELLNKKNEPFRCANVLLGIKTYASYRNDIDMSPLVSDADGLITITKAEIMEIVKEFIMGGIMDYSSLESANPDVEIYFWGKSDVNIYLGYEIDPHLEASLRFSIPNFDTEHFKKQRIEQMKDEKDYAIFKNCFNLKSDIVNNLVCLKDSWGKPQKEANYKIILPL